MAIVSSDSVSADYVRENQKLFLDAITWYSENLKQDMTERKDRLVAYLSDPIYSLICELKDKVESEKQIPPGKMSSLLAEALGKYLEHLGKLKGLSWTKEEIIALQLRQLEKVDRQGLLKFIKAGQQNPK